MSARKLHNSNVEDTALARRLKRVPLHCNDVFARFIVPGPPLSSISPADFKFFELLDLGTLARPRAVFPAIPSAEFSELPGSVLSHDAVQPSAFFFYKYTVIQVYLMSREILRVNTKAVVVTLLSAQITC
jgi:hypothetical protein